MFYLNDCVGLLALYNMYLILLKPRACLFFENLSFDTRFKSGNS